MDPERWLVVPRTAIRRVGQLEIADVWDADGKRLNRRVVRTGRARGDDIEILSGLTEGERVALPVGLSSEQAS
jgi:multidrug efflux pump subunit AcrA (membrane-fusion protein)